MCYFKYSIYNIASFGANYKEKKSCGAENFEFFAKLMSWTALLKPLKVSYVFLLKTKTGHLMTC